MAWDRKEITAYLVDVDTGDYLDFQYKVKKQPPDLTAGEFNRREC